MIETLLAFLREMSKRLKREDATKQDKRATRDGRQVRDVIWGQIPLKLCAIKAAIV